MAEALLVYTILFAGQEEDGVEARANVQSEELEVDVVADDITLQVSPEHMVCEALERRKRHGVIGYS